MRKTTIGAVALAGLLVAFGCTATETETEPATEPATTATSEPEPKATEPKAKPEPKPEPGLTVSQENALRSAEGYISMSPFSRTGLIEQLEFEGYSKADATFAVNHLDVDWSEQAARSAEAYLEMSPFSRSGLIEQLVFEGYTQKQAEYGADQAGL